MTDFRLARVDRSSGPVELCLPKPPRWTEDALCAQADPDAFYPDKGGATNRAKQVGTRRPEGVSWTAWRSTMPAESTPLTQRLVDVAVEAHRKGPRRRDGRQHIRDAERSVVAVLRELAGYIDLLGSPVQTFDALDLGELADSIEAARESADLRDELASTRAELEDLRDRYADLCTERDVLTVELEDAREAGAKP